MEEEWTPDSKLTFRHHVVAGSIAGLAEHITIFPIDTLKTYVQCERCGTSSWNCAVKIIKREGVFRLWRGVGATFMGCMPAHAAYFSVYECMKKTVGADREGHHPIQAAIAGASASVAHDSIMTPLDTVKQRMQLGYYRNITHCIQSIIKQEGIRSFYLSFPTTLLMNLPYAMVMVSTNESMKKYLNPSEKYDFIISMLSGSIAGSVAAAITTPLDVIKTRLQTHSLAPCPVSTPSLVPNFTPFEGVVVMPTTTTLSTTTSPSSSTVTSNNTVVTKHYTQSIQPLSTTTSTAPSTQSSTFSLHNINKNIHSLRQETSQIIVNIWKEEGIKGFFRGIGPRMVVHAPSVAISWTVYEGMKHLFLTQN